MKDMKATDDEIIALLNAENIGKARYAILWCDLNSNILLPHWDRQTAKEVMDFIERTIGRKSCVKQWNDNINFKKRKRSIISKFLTS